MAPNEKVFANGRIFVERPARTNTQLKYFAEDTFCRLITNVKPELELRSDLLSIAVPSALLLQILMLGAVSQ